MREVHQWVLLLVGCMVSTCERFPVSKKVTLSLMMCLLMRGVQSNLV